MFLPCNCGHQQECHMIYQDINGDLIYHVTCHARSKKFHVDAKMNTPLLHNHDYVIYLNTDHYICYLNIHTGRNHVVYRKIQYLFCIAQHLMAVNFAGDVFEIIFIMNQIDFTKRNCQIKLTGSFSNLNQDPIYHHQNIDYKITYDDYKNIQLLKATSCDHDFDFELPAGIITKTNHVLKYQKRGYAAAYVASYTAI